MFKKIILNISIVIILLSLPSINGTHAFYTDQKSITSNTLSAGWWVSPSITVTSPNGGEVWNVGSTHNITWTAVSSDPAGTITKVDVLLSTDGGGTYPITLVSGIANSGSYSWTIGDPKSTNMKVKVIATDNHGLVGSDESDNVFDPSPNPDPNTINTVVADGSASLINTDQESTESAQVESASPSADSTTPVDTTATDYVTPTPTPTPDATEVTPTPTVNPTATDQEPGSNTAENSQP